MQPRRAVGALLAAALGGEAYSLRVREQVRPVSGTDKANLTIESPSLTGNGATFSALVGSTDVVPGNDSTTFTALAGSPIDAQDLERKLSSSYKWKKYSQGAQDCIIQSLFQALGTTNKYFVEFGFNSKGYDVAADTGPNSELLYKTGWRGLLMDGGNENLDINLRKEFITPENIAGLFTKYDVPKEPDFVTIDIDSCDLYVFLGMVKEFRPRVLTIEYNANYPLEQSKVNRCKAVNGEVYYWHGDNIYGASLSAIYKAAKQNGYTVVYVEKKLDVFLVRNDLIAPGTEVPLERFRDKAGIPMHKPAPYGERVKYVIDY